MLNPDIVKRFEEHAKSKGVLCPKCKQSKYDRLTSLGVCIDCQYEEFQPKKEKVEEKKESSLLDNVKNYGNAKEKERKDLE